MLPPGQPFLSTEPGTAHGAGSWSSERLRSAGASVIAIDLPGHGDDPGPLGDLHADSARLSEVLDDLDSPVLLVGHSYGGAVITEGGVHASVRRLVYLCALAIDGHETCSTAIVEDAEKLGVVVRRDARHKRRDQCLR